MASYSSQVERKLSEEEVADLTNRDADWSDAFDELIPDVPDFDLSQYSVHPGEKSSVDISNSPLSRDTAITVCLAARDDIAKLFYSDSYSDDGGRPPKQRSSMDRLRKIAAPPQSIAPSKKPNEGLQVGRLAAPLSARL